MLRITRRLALAALALNALTVGAYAADVKIGFVVKQP